MFENSRNPLNHLPAFPLLLCSLRLSASFPCTPWSAHRTSSRKYRLRLILLLRMHDGNGLLLMAMAENSIDFWQQPSELVGLPPQPTIVPCGEHRLSSELSLPRD